MNTRKIKRKRWIRKYVQYVRYICMQMINHMRRRKRDKLYIKQFTKQEG